VITVLNVFVIILCVPDAIQHIIQLPLQNKLIKK
jgi:hypothetical protein